MWKENKTVYMQMKDRVVIMSEENIKGLKLLYGDIDIDDLHRIVNKLMEIVIGEIMEDSGISKDVPHCTDCEYAKCFDYLYRNYYCDNEDRIDDMGRLGADHLPETSPEWCPKRNEYGSTTNYKS